MCNKLHEDSVPIKKTGTGWKVFLPGNISLMEGLEYVASPDVSYNKNPLIEWIPEESWKWDANRGFCFCPAKAEALKLARRWMDRTRTRQVKVRKITYFDGLGRHEETNMMSGVTIKMALCRAFVIMEEVPPIELKRRRTRCPIS